MPAAQCLLWRRRGEGHARIRQKSFGLRTTQIRSRSDFGFQHDSPPKAEVRLPSSSSHISVTSIFEVGATRRADPGRPQASGRELNLAGESVTSRSGVSQVRDNLAGSDESLRTLAAALVELAIQILGDDKEEEIAA